MKHVLLVGATSRLGGEVRSVLANRGIRVRGLVRRLGEAPRSGDVEWVQGDLMVPSTLLPATEGVDAVISIAGAPLLPWWTPPALTFDAVDHLGTKALALAAARAGVQRFVYLSVAGDYPDDLEYVAAHRRGEAAIEAAGVSASVVRATGFHGLLCPLVDLARVGVIPVPGHGRVQTNPIAERDLAEVIADQLDAEPATVGAGGPEVLTRRAIAERAFEAVDKPPRIVAPPTGLVRLGARVLDALNPRLADVGAFVAHIHDHDAIAPQIGTTPLLESFREYASGSGMGRRE
ncbi:MAG: NAD(P)H-binding protein [Myxococcota bacterium]